MTGIRHTELRDFCSAAVMQHMQRARYGTDEVLVRFVTSDRDTLERVLTTGTDRTDASSVFTHATLGYCVGNDASPAARAEAGVTPGRVTYAFRLSLTEPVPTLRWGGRSPIGYEDMAEPMATLIEGVRATDLHTMVLVYSPQLLRRAPDAEVEYWFTGDPRSALLHVFSPLAEGASRAVG